MPRKTKELEEIPVKTTNKATNKKTVTKKVTKKDNSVKSTNSKPSGTTSKKESKVSNAKNTSKSTTKKAENSKVGKKATANKVSKSTTKKNTTKSNTVSILEYYDLPLRYNQTIVKILAQTPNMLFVYWDIADEDRKLFEEHYGNDFFSKTKPVLIIHNTTMNYSFEVEINDFANSWYLHVNDANCKYTIELGRRPYTHTDIIKEEYIYISSSNEMNSPNNHILFEKFNPSVTYKNTKTNTRSKKDFSSLANYKNMQEIYNIYDLYKTIYKDELFGEIIFQNLSNPSSSSFK